jgi:hypothetical protein
MNVLFVHQNFPAQFKHVAPRLAADHGWTCAFVTTNEKVPPLAGVERIVYRPQGGATAATPGPVRPFQNAYAHARGVYEAMKRRPDVRPDLVVAHSGFGSSLILPYAYDRRPLSRGSGFLSSSAPCVHRPAAGPAEYGRTTHAPAEVQCPSTDGTALRAAAPEGGAGEGRLWQCPRARSARPGCDVAV